MIGLSARRAAEVGHERSPATTRRDEFKTTVDREMGSPGRPRTGRRARPPIRGQAEKRRGRQADAASRVDDARHPYVLDGTRLSSALLRRLQLLADGDHRRLGATWHTSSPLVGAGNIQPSLVRRRTNTRRLHARQRAGAEAAAHQPIERPRETWSSVEDSALPNPGSGAEVRGLANGRWILVYNDLEQGRYSLAVSLSRTKARHGPGRGTERDPPLPPASAGKRRQIPQRCAANTTTRRSSRRATGRCTRPTAISSRRRPRRRTTRDA